MVKRVWRLPLLIAASSAPAGDGAVGAGLPRLLLAQPLAHRVFPVEHLAPDSDARRTHPARLPALQRVHRDGELVSELRPVEPAFEETRLLTGSGVQCAVFHAILLLRD